MLFLNKLLEKTTRYEIIFNKLIHKLTSFGSSNNVYLVHGTFWLDPHFGRLVTTTYKMRYLYSVHRFNLSISLYLSQFNIH